MIGDFVSRATKNLSDLPSFKTEDFTGAVRQAVNQIPDVTYLANTNNIACCARRVNEKVLDVVANHVPHSSILTEGANLCGDVASNLPLVRTVTRRLAPTMTVVDHKEEDPLDSQSMLGQCGSESKPQVRK